MKRILLFISITLLSIAGVNAQCIPDPSFTAPGIYPDSATGLASGCENDPYEQVITVIVPVDTTIENPLGPLFPPITLAFDSIVIVDFQGLPASGNLTYACSTTLGGCSFAGAETGCAVIQGTPTAADVGTHALTITVDVYVGGLSTPQAQEIIDWYYIDIFDATTCASSGIAELGVNGVNLFPNPTEDKLTIDGLSDVQTINIVDMNGQILRSVKTSNLTSTEIDVTGLESGIYFAYLQGTENTEVIRFMKK